MTSYRCGHCGVHTAESGFHDTGIALYPGTDHSVKWRSVQCAACGRPTLIAQGWSTGDNVTPTMYFPPEGWEPVRNIAKVPGAVGEDYKEAVDCMRAGHYKAAAVLARRAVQGVCLDLKTDPELKLYEQIDELQKQGGSPGVSPHLHTRFAFWETMAPTRGRTGSTPWK